MHQLGFDLPDRSGFDGMWSSMGAGPATTAPAASDGVRHPVTRSEGATSAAVRAALASFGRAAIEGRRTVAAA